MSMQRASRPDCPSRPSSRRAASWPAACLLLLALPFGSTVTAQDTRPTAFTNARIHTVAGETIERGTLVIKNGKIEAVGKDVTVPAGAKVVDASGKTIMPGLVSAWSRAGLTQTRSRPSAGPRRGTRRMRGGGAPSGGGRTSNQAATKIVDSLYTRQPVFGELLAVGVTSLALNPPGSGFPGLGAVLNPDGKTREELTLDDSAFVQIGMQRDAAAKKLFKDMFAKAKEVVAERTKPKAEQKPAQQPEAKPEQKPEQKPSGEQPKPDPKPNPEPKPEPKPEPTPEPKPVPTPEPKPEQKPEQKAAPKQPPAKPKDPNVELLADLLQGKQRAVLQIDSAADLLHWRTAVADDVEFPRVVVVANHDPYSGTIDLGLEHLKQWQCAVLLPPGLTTVARTSYLLNPAKTLHDAGVEIGFAVGDDPGSVRGLFFQLMELVRSGLPADVALAAVTLVPAKALGIDKRTGTLEVGKDADLLVFRGEPLSPSGQLEQVWLRGKRVENQP